MNFKDEYQKSFADIKADENFKKNLLAQMNAEKKRKKKASYVGILATAAVMILVVGLGFMTGILKGKDATSGEERNPFIAESVTDSSDDIPMDFGEELLAGQDLSEVYTEMDLSNLSWYGEAETKEELRTVFITLISGDSLVRMYCTEGEEFDDNSLMSKEDTYNLVEAISDISCTEEEYSGKDKYYKAEFEDGLTIKFWISEDGYLKLKDTGAVFQL